MLTRVKHPMHRVARSLALYGNVFFSNVLCSHFFGERQNVPLSLSIDLFIYFYYYKLCIRFCYSFILLSFIFLLRVFIYELNNYRILKIIKINYNFISHFASVRKYNIRIEENLDLQCMSLFLYQINFLSF